MTYLILFVATFFNAVGSFFLKMLSRQEAPLLSLATLHNPYLYLGVGLLALNIVGYTLWLQRVNLSVGYLVYVGLTFIIVLLLSTFVLRESLTWAQSVGILLIFAGVILAVR